MLQYADDYNGLDRYGYQPRWDIWGRLTQSIFANIPLIAGIGALVARAQCSACMLRCVQCILAPALRSIGLELRIRCSIPILRIAGPNGPHPNLDARCSIRIAMALAGNHEEEMELEFGDDYTETTGCMYPGLMGGTGGDCARAFL